MAELNFRNPKIGTPTWYLKRLSAKLDAKLPDVVRYDDYYSGKHKMDFATPKFKEAFGLTFSEFSDNWCGVVIDAEVERMEVQGFRYGDGGGDKKAWEIWQSNNLDALHVTAQLEGLVKGESYGLVWPDDDGQPIITIEDATECCVEYVGGTSRRVRSAALKRWIDDSGYVFATLYRPEAIYKFQSKRKVDTVGGVVAPIQWEQREVENELWPLPNPFNVVTVVPLPNKPRLLKGGVSEISDAIPLQDAINKTITDMLVTSEFTAAPQRYAIGFKPPTDDNGNPLPVFEKLINRLWVSSNPDSKFGQFPQADLGGYVSVVELFVQHFASRTRTPPHYFALNGAFPSGDSIKSAETGLVAKSTRQMVVFGEGWEEIMRIAFLIKGDKKRSQEQATETIWKDPESRTESEHIDAVGKKVALLHWPIEQAWLDAGASPEQVERMKVQLREQADWLPQMTAPQPVRDQQIAAGQSPDEVQEPVA